MKIRQICMVVLLWLGVIPAVQAQVNFVSDLKIMRIRKNRTI